MKNVKLFLTATTFCLALAAVAGTKANGKFATRGFTEDPNTHKCTVDSNIDCNGGSTACVDGAGNQLFVKSTTNGCTVALFKTP